MPSAKTGDISIYYELHGQGEPLVLITGLSNDVSQYEHIIARLSQKYRVLAFDNRGSGRTDKPDKPYSMEQMADDTAGLMEATGIGRAHVVGISMGGRIAMALALRHPERVKRLALASTFARQIGPTGKMPGYVRGSSKYPQPEYAFFRQLIASRSYDCSGRLGEIHVPTLVMHGKHDTLVPIGLAEEIHDGIKGSQIIAIEGGHVFFMSRPDGFCDAIIRFLSATDNF